MQDRSWVEGMLNDGHSADEVAEIYRDLNGGKKFIDPTVQQHADAFHKRALEAIMDAKTQNAQLLGDAERQRMIDDAVRVLHNDPSADFLALKADIDEQGKTIDRSIDPDVGERFDAHGIAKGTARTQFDALTSILGQGIDASKSFHSAPLEIPAEKRAALGAALGTGGGTAYKEGSFVLLGEIDRPITDGIKYVIVNPSFQGSLERLRQVFPAVEFIASQDARTRLREIADQAIA